MQSKGATLGPRWSYSENVGKMMALLSLNVTDSKDESEENWETMVVLPCLIGGETEASDGRSQTWVCINVILRACEDAACRQSLIILGIWGHFIKHMRPCWWLIDRILRNPALSSHLRSQDSQLGEGRPRSPPNPRPPLPPRAFPLHEVIWSGSIGS